MDVLGQSSSGKFDKLVETGYSDTRKRPGQIGAKERLLSKPLGQGENLCYLVMCSHTIVKVHLLIQGVHLGQPRHF